MCAWCKRKLGEIEPMTDDRLSHGICPECRARVMQEMLAEKILRINGGAKGD
jgi:DNA-directed RNA polymerase subunit RPC12/RpoP